MSQLKVNSIIPVAGVPTGGGGGIIQIKQSIKTDTFTHSSETPALITGLTASITPTSTSSKILICMDVNYVPSAGNFTSMLYIYRDGSVLTGAIGDAAQSNQLRVFKAGRAESSNQPQSTNGIFLHSPATDSATTYQIYVSQEGGSTFHLNKFSSESNVAYHPRFTSAITVMEVSA